MRTSKDLGKIQRMLPVDKQSADVLSFNDLRSLKSIDQGYAIHGFCLVDEKTGSTPYIVLITPVHCRTRLPNLQEDY